MSSSDGKATSNSGLCLNFGRPDSSLQDGYSVDADGDTEDVSTLNDEGPGTPPEAEDITTPPPHISSPSIPSPMSWGKLDLFTPLGQHLAASLARSPEKSPPVSLRGGQGDSDDDTPQLEVKDDLSEDGGNLQSSRDAFVQRLQELARKVSQGDNALDQATLDALHSEVNNMDRVVAGHKPHRPQRPRPTSLQKDPHGMSQDQESSWSSPSSSWMRSRYSDLSVSTKRDSPPVETQAVMKKPAVDSFKIASEAEKLNTELETLLNNLKARQEESEHIHALLITRAERAAQRIIFLQSRVHLLESELHESDADLSHLRLGLKAIEVQCPHEILARDTELAQSIVNWKRDYAELKLRRAARRRRAFAEEASPIGDEGQGSITSADTSMYSEATDENTSSILSTPSRPPRQAGPGSNLLGPAFETPSPPVRTGRAQRPDAMSRLAAYRDALRGGGVPRGDDNEETLTPTSAGSRSTATSTRQDLHATAFETSGQSTHSSRALRRIIMSATPPRRSLDSQRLVPLTSFGPPLQRSNSARAIATQHRQHHHYEPLR